jgi:hypothetical protein
MNVGDVEMDIDGRNIFLRDTSTYQRDMFNVP